VVKTFFSKLLTLFIFLKYPKIPSQQRWFIRFRYLGIFNQIKYFFKDYVILKPYKVISFKGEFQQELLHVIPFAYWHHLNGTLLRTESSEFTKDLYFFSQNHTEHINLIRDYKDNENIEIPNAPHDTELLRLKWKKAPFKSRFKNNKISFDKEILIIANRYNSEWDKEPISFFSLEDLNKLFEAFQDDYQIIYNRPPKTKIALDNSDVKELHDDKFIRVNYPQVIILEDLNEMFDMKAHSYNHLQLLVYANASKFISIHGGTATLASMFGGRNLIYSKEGHEHALNEFINVFPKLSGTKIKVLRSKVNLIEEAKIFINQHEI